MTHKEAVDTGNYIRMSGKKLTPWEDKFLKGVLLWNGVSNKQANCLIKIYERVTGGGPWVKKEII